VSIRIRFIGRFVLEMRVETTKGFRAINAKVNLASNLPFNQGPRNRPWGDNGRRAHKQGYP